MTENLTNKDLKLLNSKKGILQFLKEEDFTIPKILRYCKK